MYGSSKLTQAEKGSLDNVTTSSTYELMVIMLWTMNSSWLLRLRHCMDLVHCDVLRIVNLNCLARWTWGSIISYYASLAHSKEPTILLI